MSIFPGPFGESPFGGTTFGAPQFDPRFVNIGALYFGNVADSSVVSVGGDGSYGDTFSHRKWNQGFGAVLGSANVIPANMNFVLDADIFDQIGSQFQNKLTTRTTA